MVHMLPDTDEDWARYSPIWASQAAPVSIALHLTVSDLAERSWGGGATSCTPIT